MRSSSLVCAGVKLSAAPAGAAKKSAKKPTSVITRKNIICPFPAWPHRRCRARADAPGRQAGAWPRASPHAAPCRDRPTRPLVPPAPATPCPYRWWAIDNGEQPPRFGVLHLVPCHFLELSARVRQIFRIFGFDLGLR